MEERNTSAGERKGSGLSPYLSPFGVWALALGCAVGWGAFVMPGTTFLPLAGPVGTLLGLAIGGAIMLVVGVNYAYMINRYPDAGGTFTYAKRVLGYDHGFLSAWFLVLVYVAITWANSTALPLVFRNLLGGLFQFGPHYTVAGYDVYLGEALLSLAALELCGLLCMYGKRAAGWVQTALAVLLFGGVLIVGAAALRSHGGDFGSFSPAFVPGSPPAMEILRIVALAPWAFVGFESVSHSVEEFRFSPKKTFPILCAAVVTGALAYIFLAVLAVSALPEKYGTWTDYIRDIGHLPGLEGLPTFYAVRELMGRPGMILLGATVVAGVVTGLIGNSIAASRLLYAMARDHLLPQWFGKQDASRTPKNAVIFIMLIFLPIPFFGRTAIGWIVDVNTIGATIAYAYTSVVAYQTARKEENRTIQLTGLAGIVFSLLFFFYFLIPNFWSASALSTESYMILIVWSVLGFIFFRFLLYGDKERRFGQSTVVWIVILFLIFFTSTLWVREATQDTARMVIHDLSEYNTQELRNHRVALTPTEARDTEYYIQTQMDLVSQSLMKNSLLQMVLVMLTLAIMFSVYDLMQKREQEMEVRRIEAEQNSRAKSTFLSNMSHDIRTPMNAIIGYTTLSRKEKDIPPKVAEYLTKIEASSGHLLSLINDVLEMSRIESGKMELEIVKSDLVKTLREVRDLFITQMETKGIVYTVSADGVSNRMVLCDANRLNRVLLNLISNAYKFTPKGGSVSVTLTQTGATRESGSYELRVKDSGMGMSPEFAARVFEAYERERTASNIQGTGLGMAITKSIVDLMHGTIELETEQGKGSEFIIRVDFPLAGDDGKGDGESAQEENSAEARDFSGTRLLLVEDNEINREIAVLLLEEAGFQLDTAENGQIAVDKIAASRPGDYQLILMDIQMPVMNGYDAARAIRSLRNPKLARLPIIAMTANAFSEDIQAAKDAGMDGHIAKPIDVDKMIDTINGYIAANPQKQ